MKKLVFLLGLILLLSGGCKYFKKSAPKSVDIVTADTDSVGQIYDSSAYYGASDAGTYTEPVQTAQKANAITGKYYMIVGCFTVADNADNYAELMISKGYEAQIIPGAANFQMVAAREYGSYRESVSELDKFRSDVTPNAWVYRQR